MDVGDVDTKAQKLLVGVDEKLNPEDIKKHLLVHAPEDKKELSERDGREVAVGMRRLTGSGHRPGRAERSPLWEPGGRHGPVLRKTAGCRAGTGLEPD